MDEEVPEGKVHLCFYFAYGEGHANIDLPTHGTVEDKVEIILVALRPFLKSGLQAVEDHYDANLGQPSVKRLH